MMASNVSRDVSQDQSSVVQTCKPWYAFATVAAGRFVRFASRVTKHGGTPEATEGAGGKQRLTPAS